uniref:Uncharacterized protein n=1 Tax=Davidia involucrata TaxID=16924 RepID=A0A5B6ZXR1_DAVIN
MAHHTDIEERDTDIEEGVQLPGSSGLKRADPKIVHGITKKIHHLLPLPREACIFRVHDELRNVKKKAYTPMLVSIGPYHHGNPKLRAMEEHKLRYLRSLLERNNEENAERYLQLMETIVDRARGFYADPISLKRDKFVEMMLLDACFTIEFLRKFEYEYLRDKDDPIFKSSWMQIQIFGDMMLLENQLPFFLLSELFKMTEIPNLQLTLLQFSLIPIFQMLPIELSSSSLNSILQMLPAELSSISLNHPGKKSAHENKHFLDLLHNVYLPSFGEASSNKTSMSSNKNCIRLPYLTEFLDLLHDVCLRLFGKASSNKKDTRMPSLTELQEAGVSFKVDESDAVSLFDINFKRGHLKIPKFRVTDLTETFFRNIIAYEQHSSDVKPKYFTDYTFFMDKLIDTQKDVTTLRLRGIMDNWLGDDEEVARMFNKMGDGRIVDTSTYYYSNVCQELNDHCKKGWNEAKAKLRRNYFHNPWASISTAAAIFLILLTLIQTVATLVSLFV